MLRLKDYLLKTILFTALYYFFGRLGLALATINHNASPVWPASGLAATLLFRYGIRFWPSVFAGAYLVNLATPISTLSTSLISFGNATEAIIASLFLSSIGNWESRLIQHTRTIFLLTGGLAAAFISAAIGTWALSFSKVVTYENWFSNFSVWWGGDILGILLLVPILNSWQKERLVKLTHKAVFEGIFYLLVSCSTIFLILSGKLTITYLIIIACALFLSEMRLPVFVSNLFLVLYSLFTTLLWFENSPFFARSLELEPYYLQLYLLTVVITGYVLRDLWSSLYIGYVRLIFGFGTLLSIGLFSFLYSNNEAKNKEHFSTMVTEATHLFEESARDIEAELSGGAAFLTANSFKVTHSQWKKYVETADLNKHLPGLNGIGIVIPVPKGEYAYHEKRMLSLEAPKDFKIHSLKGSNINDSEEAFVISYLEPLDINRSALGLDLASEQNRKLAAKRARDTGIPTMTGKITLVQDAKKRPGFLFYSPVYRVPLSEHATIEERRKEFVAWIYSPFVLEDFLTAVYKGKYKEIGFSILDNDAPGESVPIYSSHPSQNKVYLSKTSMNLAQTPFTMAWFKTDHFESKQDPSSAWMPVFALMVTLLATSLTSNLYYIQKRAEKLAKDLTKELSESESRLNEAQRMGKIGSFYRYFDSEKTYWSNELYQLWGFDSKLGPPPYEKIIAKLHPDDANSFLEFMTNIRLTTKMLDLEYRIISESGLEQSMRSSVIAITDEQGKIIGVKGTTRDVTESAQANRQLELQKQKLIYTSKMSSLGEMAAGISHEINNPLAIISGKVALLRNSVEAEKLVKEKFLTDLSKIDDTVKRISLIIKGLRNFSRNSEGDPFGTGDFSNIVNESLELCRARFHHHGINIETNLATNNTIHCRTTQVAQILLNLLNNAYDAIENLEEKWIRISSEVEGNFLKVTVTDSGKGISEQTLNKIFQPFYTTKEVGKGTGLGLSISKGIAEEHGGKLWYVKSKNTTFSFTIPLEKAQALPQAA